MFRETLESTFFPHPDFIAPASSQFPQALYSQQCYQQHESPKAQHFSKTNSPENAGPNEIIIPKSIFYY